jgi:hypothetical protein
MIALGLAVFVVAYFGTGWLTDHSSAGTQLWVIGIAFALLLVGLPLALWWLNRRRQAIRERTDTGFDDDR